MKLIKTLVALIVVCFHFGTAAQTNQSSTVVVDRNNEVMFKLQDSGGDYSGFWTMNDGEGNMAIKLGIDGNGKYTVTNDGAAEVLWGAHGQAGFMSLNAAKKGAVLTDVPYNISLIVDSGDQAIKVSNPNNNTGGTGSNGLIIANATGDLVTDQLLSRSSSGMNIDLGGSDGDISLYDAAGTEYILGDQVSGDNTGMVLRTITNPTAGEALFIVESAGYSERLRVDHDGALATTNHLHVINDGGRTSIINGKLRTNDAISIGTSTFLPDFQLNVNGAIRSKEIVCESAPWPDYVFEEDYDLKSLSEIEDFIEEEGHLPNIPSAEDVAAEGVPLAKMNALLLEKIEELTLHMIELQKEKDQQLERLKHRIEQLENQ